MRLTVAEVAEELRCSKQFVLDELHRRNLRGSKAANWTITPEDLKTYIDARANVRPVRKP